MKSSYFCKDGGFIKLITDFLYNRRCHSFPYNSSRLDPHSDYSRFWSAGRNRKAVSATLYRIKKVCSFVQAREPSLFQSCSLPSTSLRQSSLTARSRRLSVSGTSSVLCKIICFLSPRHNNYLFYSLLFCQYTQDFCKDETEFPNIQMPFGVHTVSDRELWGRTV